MAASKCVHKGCNKMFTQAEEACQYHPGPPEFHEGQKGWKCCKPRVLTFDEFMNIPPCTTGTHSTIDDTPTVCEPKQTNEELDAQIKRAAPIPTPRAPLATPNARASPPSLAPPGEDDDPDTPVPNGATCKRKSCGVKYTGGPLRECVHHPGQALFHEGSKGWTCCKRRVLDFDDFMQIAGCRTQSRHLFVGKTEEALKHVRNDFYQTATSVIASLYLKNIDKESSKVAFRDGGNVVELDLHTSDAKTYQTTVELYGLIKPGESKFKIMATKLELTLAKADGQGWPVLRADDPHTGEIIQAGRAGRV